MLKSLLIASILLFFNLTKASAIEIKVFADVNNKAITNFDLKERIKFLSNSGGAKISELSKAKDQVLMQMVNEYVLIEFLKARGNDIDQKVIDGAYKRSKNTACKGVTQSNCKNFIKAEIVKASIIQSFPDSQKGEKMIEFISRAKKFIPNEII